MTEEIPKSAPLVNVGNRLCALFERTYKKNNGEMVTVLQMSEVVAARTERKPNGDVVTLAWREAYKGVRLAMKNRDEWVRFLEDLNAAFANGIQERLNAKTVPALFANGGPGPVAPLGNPGRKNGRA